MSKKKNSRTNCDFFWGHIVRYGHLIHFCTSLFERNIQDWTNNFLANKFNSLEKMDKFVSHKCKNDVMKNEIVFIWNFIQSNVVSLPLQSKFEKITWNSIFTLNYGFFYSIFKINNFTLKNVYFIRVIFFSPKNTLIAQFIGIILFVQK